MINKSVKTIGRRRLVIDRLENQLKSGVKVNRIKDITNSNKIAVISTPLSEKDINRIKKEIETLKTRIGVISIETPVRRQMDRMFTYANLEAITNYAKHNEISTHLDGARLFVQSVHTTIAPAGYGALFDTVYTSLWKCFNAASGAVLAGSKSFTTNLFHERRMFGGGLPYAWPFAAVALFFADSFTGDYTTAWKNAEQFFAIIQKEERFTIIKFENGSHIVRLNIQKANLNRFKESLDKVNIELPVPDENGFLLKINPSLNRETPQDIAETFIKALKASS